MASGYEATTGGNNDSMEDKYKIQVKLGAFLEFFERN